MKKVKIFLAHTKEVKEDVIQIRNSIQSQYQESDKYQVVVEHWSDADKSLRHDRFQDRLNEVIGTCELLYLFFHDKVGKYTKEEFYYGLDRFEKGQKPYAMNLFYKDFSLPSSASKEKRNEINETLDFIEEVKGLNGNQYIHNYTNIDDLKHQFLQQLKKDLETFTAEKSVIDELFVKKRSEKIYLKENMLLANRDPNFVGREIEIQQVFKYLINSQHCAITGVIGNGGVGKSALANEIVHIIKDSWRGVYGEYLKKRVFSDGVMWIRLEHDLTIEQVYQEQIIKQLGVKLSMKNFEVDIHKMLRDKEILVVIDSAEQNESLFLELMFLFRNYPLMITSRKRDIDVPIVDVNILGGHDSLEMFKKYLVDEYSRRAISKDIEKKITEFCVNRLGGLPLAIKIVANYMKRTRRDLNDIDNLLSLTAQDKFRGRRSESLQSAFALSFNTLSDDAKKVFAIGSVFVYPFLEETLLEIAKEGGEMQSVRNEIDAIIGISLIEKNGEYYSYHPLVREYALEKLYSFSFNEAIWEAYKERLKILSKQESLLPHLYNELLVILANDYKLGKLDRYFEIIKNMDWWLQGVGYPKRREDLLFSALKESKEIKDKRNEYYFLVSYGDVMNRKEEYLKAQTYFSEALEHEITTNYFFIRYSLFAIEHKLGHFESSYKHNLEYSRKALSCGKNIYSSFLKTNAWISNSYAKYDKSLDYALSDNYMTADKSNNFKALKDLVTIFFLKGEYATSLKYIEALEDYFNDPKYDLADKIEVSIFKLWIYLYTNREGLITQMDSFLNRFNLLSANNSTYDTFKTIELLYLLETKAFEKAKELLETFKTEEYQWQAKGLYYFYLDDSVISKESFEKYIAKKELSSRAKASGKIYLANIYAKEAEKEKAAKLLVEAQILLENYMNPIEEKVFQDTIEKIGFKAYETLKLTLSLDIVDDRFFLADLPKSIVGRDRKKMLLVPKGLSIYSEDNFPMPTVEDIFNEPDRILNNEEKLKAIRYLGDFYIDEEVVTNAEYIVYCEENGIYVSDTLREEEPTKPIQGLKLEEMEAYAAYYDKSLPLPEEWEKACRGDENLNYPWGNRWDDGIEIKIGDSDFEELKALFVDYNSFEEYFEWFENHTDDEHLTLGMLDTIQFSATISVDRYYFFKILFNSLSLDTLEKFRVIDAIPTLSQFQVDELTTVWTEEVNNFSDLNKEHPDDIVKLFAKIKHQALDIIGELTLKGAEYIESSSPYGIKNMIGNGYELTLRDESVEERLVFKGSIVTYDYKERFKAKNGWSSKDREQKYSRTSFRCVKPIFCWEDLKEFNYE